MRLKESALWLGLLVIVLAVAAACSEGTSGSPTAPSVGGPAQGLAGTAGTESVTLATHKENHGGGGGGGDKGDEFSSVIITGMVSASGQVSGNNGRKGVSAKGQQLEVTFNAIRTSAAQCPGTGLDHKEEGEWTVLSRVGATIKGDARLDDGIYVAPVGQTGEVTGLADGYADAFCDSALAPDPCIPARFKLKVGDPVGFNVMPDVLSDVLTVESSQGVTVTVYDAAIWTGGGTCRNAMDYVITYLF